MKLEHKNISKEMCKDSGLALVLICMICYLVWKHQFLILLAIAFLLVAMTYPPIFKPFARFWFGLSTAPGNGGFQNHFDDRFLCGCPAGGLDETSAWQRCHENQDLEERQCLCFSPPRTPVLSQRP